jgi:hypothetical protein
MLRTRNASIWLPVRLHAVAVICILLSVTAGAKSLRVSPAHYTWNGVTPGAQTQALCTIQITNVSGQQRAYKLTARSCAEAQLTPFSGCEDIPDTSWVEFERRCVSIKANEQVQIKVRLNVPAGRQYSNRSWQSYIEVREDVPQYGYIQGQPDLFALAIFLKIVVNTAQAADTTAQIDKMNATYCQTTGVISNTDDKQCQLESLLGGWLCYGTVSDIERLLRGPMGPIIARRNTCVHGCI